MRIVGQSIKREDGSAKVRGNSRYVADLKVAGMLYGRVLWSTVPYATELTIDKSQAETLPGVYAVLTANDIPGKNINPLIKDDQPFLARDRIMYPGEALALVAASSPEAADEAIRKISVSFTERQPVITIEESLAQNEPKLYGEDNVFSAYKIRKGDLEQGLAEADVKLTETFTTGYQEHAYLEPQGMVAIPEDDGSMTVYGSMQCPFYVQAAVSAILGIPLSRSRIVQMTTGGAFGGKEDVPSLVAGWAALLARSTNRPVKLILNREEDIRGMSKRHPSKVQLTLGAKHDGTLTALKAQIYLDGGAYVTLSPVVLWRSTVHVVGPYRCPNVQVDSAAVATNKVPSGAFRGFGSPQVIFAMESLMDMLAEQLGIDPLELRLKNVLLPGDETATAHHLDNSVGVRETLTAASNRAMWSQKKQGSGKIHDDRAYGIGVSTIMYGVGLGAGGKNLDRSGAFVQIHKDGSVSVAVGTTEMGQGMRTVLAQIAAEALGLSMEHIHVLPVDTSRVPDSGPTVASRATLMSGNAILDACQQITIPLLELAGHELQEDPSQLVFGNGIIGTPDGSKQIELLKVIAEAFTRRQHLAAQGWFQAPFTSFNEYGLGDAYYTYSFMTNIVEVEVDILTGETFVTKVTSAVDIGTPINPQAVEGQIQGGVLQGLGYGLSEEIILNGCHIINPNFSCYIIPTSLDAPTIEPIVVSTRYDKGPFGAKGLGELPLMGLAPAVTNAIYNAVGVRIKDLPAKPERVYRGLSDLDNGLAALHSVS